MSNPGIPESQLTAESTAETGESFGDLLSQYDKGHSRKSADGGKQLVGTVIVVTGPWFTRIHTFQHGEYPGDIHDK
jgi:hypothetical protein